ncbi:hypothetical protein [Membranihabitans marinus]|nr:hypothetical protein [Membranihabitans marinus]
MKKKDFAFKDLKVWQGLSSSLCICGVQEDFPKNFVLSGIDLIL